MKDWLESLFMLFAFLLFFTLIVAFGLACFMGMAKLISMLWALLFM